jgi:hypothetical protein
MSITTEISRIQSARNDIRTALVAWGVAESTDDIDALATAIEAIANNGAVSGTISTKTGTYLITAGYHMDLVQ